LQTGISAALASLLAFSARSFALVVYEIRKPNVVDLDRNREDFQNLLLLRLNWKSGIQSREVALVCNGHGNCDGLGPSKIKFTSAIELIAKTLWKAPPTSPWLGLLHIKV
jgi:hypothetical protein